ncbi:hypothetical protein [Flavobacterium haoranii]|uniref:Uncharacterized protein n=1 Tax=Flavobacterium haoranii TaxID=683124 RepID=A0A1M6C5J0_9FLAO|nr:hypothetical protein [Flavobacterium haoranii]SHI56290.1 hypothetical protein SAMN05444337_0286 [Flavobacterium haoranii]
MRIDQNNPIQITVYVLSLFFLIHNLKYVIIPLIVIVGLFGFYVESTSKNKTN